jgi:hypothetical protein
MTMKIALCVIVALACVIAPVFGDLYGHGIIRFSNNRLNEQSANRDNGDRLFDSQVFLTRQPFGQLLQRHARHLPRHRKCLMLICMCL